MKLARSRSLGLLVAAGVALAVVPTVVPVATAASGNLPYTCKISGNTAPVTVTLDTSAPYSVAPGSSIQPVLTASVYFPASVVNGLRSNLNATAIAGSGGKVAVKTNGASTTVSNLTFPSVPLEQDKAVTAKATATMAKLTDLPEGSVVYKPGDLTALTLNLTGSGFAPVLACTLGATSANIDTVIVSNTPPPPPPTVVATSIAAAKAYSRKKDKLTIGANVKSSGATPTGKVTIALFKSGKKIRTATLTLVGGKAKVVFTKVRKGSYKYTITYGGSATKKPSTYTSAKFKLKK
ncbi:hypothetical protein ABIE44_002800 [Marmoricola sp. OAE513]|uniref:Ig-like domain repeat protein n=1 Tax=Marmoricola sp. OAE513 TaxID=2817894 RepID=UPI001AE68AC9